jgi:hypothetical protein
VGIQSRTSRLHAEVGWCWNSHVSSWQEGHLQWEAVRSKVSSYCCRDVVRRRFEIVENRCLPSYLARLSIWRAAVHVPLSTKEFSDSRGFLTLFVLYRLSETSSLLPQLPIVASPQVSMFCLDTGAAARESNPVPLETLNRYCHSVTYAFRCL